MRQIFYDFESLYGEPMHCFDEREEVSREGGLELENEIPTLMIVKIYLDLDLLLIENN